MSARLIGLIGRKRVGKDTLARRLVEAHGFTRFAFADRLREAALGLNPIVVPSYTDWGSLRLSELVGRYGWEHAKESPEVRRTLQNYGMAIRQIDKDFWVRPVMAEIAEDPRPAVVTDVRFPNEAAAIEAAGGMLVRVTRSGLDESDTHESETALATRPVSHHIVNDAGVSDLFEAADKLVTG